jgi:hypothetical protein
LLISNGRFAGIPPPRVFCQKRLQVIENKGRGLARAGKEAPSLCKQKSWRVCRSVETGSVLNLLRMEEILGPRGADDGEIAGFARQKERVVSSVRSVESQNRADGFPDRACVMGFGRTREMVAWGIRISKGVYIERSNFGVEWGKSRVEWLALNSVNDIPWRAGLPERESRRRRGVHLEG